MLEIYILTGAAVSSPGESNASASRSTPELAPSDRNSIGFLLNCPGETDFLHEFPKSSTLSPNSKVVEYQNIMNRQQSYEPPLATINNGASYPDYGHLVQETNLDVFLSSLEFETFKQQNHNWQMPTENVIPWSSCASVDRDVLEQRAYEIREKLKYTAASLNAPDMPPKDILNGIDMITADKIAAWVKLYFIHWHKHAPAVHEASFNLCGAAIPLVLALISIGGMVRDIPQ